MFTRTAQPVFSLLIVETIISHFLILNSQFLRKSLYVTVHNVDVLRLRNFGQPRHTEYLTGNGYKHFRAVIDNDVFDVELEVIDCAVYFGVGGERVLRLGYADGIMRDAHFFDELHHLA